MLVHTLVVKQDTGLETVDAKPYLSDIVVTLDMPLLQGHKGKSDVICGFFGHQYVTIHTERVFEKSVCSDDRQPNEILKIFKDVTDHGAAMNDDLDIQIVDMSAGVAGTGIVVPEFGTFLVECVEQVDDR